MTLKTKEGDLESSSPHQRSNGSEIEVSAASHTPVLEQSFGLISACATGVTTGNSWAVLGGGIVASLYNGGSPGVIYEFIVVSIFYGFIGASIAELASAVPSSGGVYQWATITAGPRYGRICGWFAGWLNGLAWAFAVASNCVMLSNMIVYAYGLYHPDFVPERWQIYICYLIISWGCCFTVMFAQRALSFISRLGSFLIMAGFLIAVIVCAVMPSQTGSGYASNAVIWKEWNNLTGYSSTGFVFISGMLNGAFAIGAIDCVTHIAEEIPDARRSIPKALACQVIMGLITGFCYLVAIFYATNDLSAIINGDSICPLGDIYLQATGSKAGSVGLLVVSICPILCATVGCYITTGRTFYALGRGDATPFSRHIGAVSRTWGSPFYSTLACGIFMTCIGAIYVGSLTAFNAFIGSYAVLTTISYLLAILPHMLSGRKYLRPGPFSLGRYGAAVNAVACAYIVVTIVVFCFPYTMPVSAESMNYTCVIVTGLSALVALWWFVHGRKNYIGPGVDVAHE